MNQGYSINDGGSVQNRTVNKANDANQDTDNHVTKNSDLLLQKKSLRRFSKNENAWNLSAPKQSTIRNESSRSKTIRDLRDLGNLSSDNSFSLRTKASLDQRHSNSGIQSKSLRNLHKMPNKSTQQMPWRDKLADIWDNLKDEYRRATESANDPYVKVSLKPTSTESVYDFYTSEINNSFKTSTIVGGGSHVKWNNYSDHNEHTFLLNKDEKALKNKYLKIEVFDYESGVSDRLLGVATIITKTLSKEIGKTHYATLNLYENNISSGYAWAGTIEISATFKKLMKFQVEDIKQQSYTEIEKKGGTKKSLSSISRDHNIRNREKRAMTDQLVLGRMGSRGATPIDDPLFQYEKNLERISTETQTNEEQKARINSVQGMIIDFVLFASLILSGTLFFGAMNLYEVELQIDFMRNVHNTQFSIIDSMHWSFTTVSTVGFGDFYPQTTGGRIFGSFFIMFGVSLLGRLLGFMMKQVTKDFIDRQKRIKTFRKCISWDQMSEWDLDGDGKISDYEFLVGMLLRRGDTTKDVIDEIMNIFDEYDEDGDGHIEVEELKKKMTEKAKEIQKKLAEQQQIEKKENNNDDDMDNEDMDNYRKHTDPTNQATRNFYDYLDEDEDEDEDEYALHVEIRAADHLKESAEIEAAEDSLWRFLLGWLAFILYLIFGALIFAFVEHRDFGDMLWMFIVTTCTVGYGDVYPLTKIGKILNGFFIAISVVLFVMIFGTAFDFIYKRQELLVNKNTKQKHKMDDMIDAFHFNTLQDVLSNKNNENNDNAQSLTKIEENNNDMIIIQHPKKRMDNLFKLDTIKSSKNLDIGDMFDNDKDDEKKENNKNYEKRKNIASKLDAVKSSKNLDLGHMFDDDGDNDDGDDVDIDNEPLVAITNAISQQNDEYGGYSPVKTNDNTKRYVD